MLRETSSSVAFGKLIFSVNKGRTYHQEESKPRSINPLVIDAIDPSLRFPIQKFLLQH